MNVSSHQPSKAKQVFMHVVELASEVERAEYLESACAGDPQLRQLVEEMVAAASRTSPLDWVTSDFKPDTKSFDSLRADMEDHPLIGPYKLMEKIGEGGMGVVYVAQQQQPIRRRVALKLIKPGMDSKQVVARFQAERQTLALMNHANIAKVLDAGTTEAGLPFFVMELVRGVPITDYCDTHKLDLRQRLELFIKVCEAVQHAHQKGIIHRDLKPSNVLVELDDVRAIPKVIDFGIAKAMQQPLAENTIYTGIAQMIGTPLYMSPEQAQLNSLDVDTRSDVYSLGVLLYELLTGSTPFNRDMFKQVGFDEIRRIIREDEPQRPSTRVTTLDGKIRSTIAERRHVDPLKLSHTFRGELDWIVMRCLEKDRARRYGSASALAADVQRYLNDEPVQACPPSTAYRARKFSHRYRVPLMVAAMITCMLITGLGTTGWQAVRAARAEQVALSGLENEREARIAEQEARMNAEQARMNADQAKDLAQRNASDAYRQQYKAEMQLGLVDLAAGNITRLYGSLAGHLPKIQRDDRRGWEWYYLLSRCQEGRTLCEHYNLVSSIAWSPDGQCLGTTSYDGDAIVWNASSGQRVRRISFGGTLKRGVAWSPDSQHLAWGSVGGENAVRIWDRGTDKVRVLSGHASSLMSCAWSPDSGRLATTSMDKTARIWDAQSGDCLHVLGGHSNHVNAVVWLDDGNSLVTAGHGGVKVWDAQSGDLLRELLSDTDFTAMSISSARPQQLVLGTSYGGKCLLIEVDSWLTIQELKAHAGKVNGVAFNPDGTTYASAGSDGTVSIWDVADGRQRSVLRGPQMEVTSLAWNPNGRQLAAACSDGKVKLWEVPLPQQPISFQAAAKAIQTIRWSKDDELLTSVSETASTCTVWDCSTKAIVKTTVAQPGARETLGPDGRLKASASINENDDGFKIIVTDVITDAITCELEFSHQSKGKLPPVMVWAPDNKRLVAHDSTHFDVWSVPEGQRMFTWDGPRIGAVGWAPDSSRLAVAGGGDRTDDGTQQYMGYVHIFDVELKTRLQKVRLASQRVTATTVAWDSIGEMFAAGNGSGQIAVWDASTGHQLSIARPHVASVRGLDWIPDGHRIASLSEDGSLKILDPLTGDELLTLTNGKQPLTAVKWSSDGTRLAAGDNTGRIQVWDRSAGLGVSGVADQHRSLAQLHAIRGGQARENGDLTQAIVEFSRAIELAPSRAAYRRSRAIVHARQGGMEQALADLTAALDLDPDDTQILIARLDLYAGLGRWTEAIVDASRLVELKQTGFDRYQQAVIYLMLKQIEAYRAICQQTIAAEPSETYEAAFTCALVPAAVPDYERILAKTREYVNAQPRKHSGDLTGLGALHYRAGRVEDAVVTLLEANRVWEQAGSVVSPSSSADRLPGYAWYFLAMACHDLGRYAESRTWYDKAEAYTQTALAQPDVFLQAGSIVWHRRIVLKWLQREAREALGVSP